MMALLFKPLTDLDPSSRAYTADFQPAFASGACNTDYRDTILMDSLFMKLCKANRQLTLSVGYGTGYSLYRVPGTRCTTCMPKAENIKPEKREETEGRVKKQNMERNTNIPFPLEALKGVGKRDKLGYPAKFQGYIEDG